MIQESVDKDMIEDNGCGAREKENALEGGFSEPDG